MDNLRCLLGIMRMDKVPNARITELRGVRKGVYEKITEVAPRRFGHVERIENDRCAKRIYVRKCAG